MRLFPHERHVASCPARMRVGGTQIAYYVSSRQAKGVPCVMVGVWKGNILDVKHWRGNDGLAIV